MNKKLTEGQKKAARRPGVGGKKHGLWPAVWHKRHREVTGKSSKSGRGRGHSQATRDKISAALKRHHRKKK